MADEKAMLEAEIAALKRELSATKQESARWYQAFLTVIRERDLLSKELAALR